MNTIVVTSNHYEDMVEIIDYMSNYSAHPDSANWFQTDLSFQQIQQLINFCKELSSSIEFDSSWAGDRIRRI